MRFFACALARPALFLKMNSLVEPFFYRRVATRPPTIDDQFSAALNVGLHIHFTA